MAINNIEPLKAGTQTGSLINHLMSGSANAAPEVGMGATILGWTDRYPATIIEVLKDGKQVIIQEDKYERVGKNGMSESQEYIFSRNPDALKVVYTLRTNGAHVRKGESKNGSRLRIGERSCYYDYSF